VSHIECWLQDRLESINVRLGRVIVDGLPDRVMHFNAEGAANLAQPIDEVLDNLFIRSLVDNHPGLLS
jgi:hypothetical protein